MPRLIKDRKARELALPSKAAGTWRYVPAKEETDWSFVHISFPEIILFLICIYFSYLTYFVSFDCGVICSRVALIKGRATNQGVVHFLVRSTSRSTTLATTSITHHTSIYCTPPVPSCESGELCSLSFCCAINCSST